MDTPWHGRSRLVALGVLSGVAAGALVAGLAGAALPRRAADDPDRPFIEATHLPPLLTAPDEQVDLRYDAYCDPTEGQGPVDGCDATGSVFFRPGNAGSFQEIPLELDPTRVEGRYVARLPDAVASSRRGFSYYAILRSVATGATTTIPAGGATAPDQSFPLGRSVDIGLGVHVFGVTRSPTRHIAEAAWGDSRDDVGLEQGPNLTPIGGSSFDVTPSGAVSVLDEAHHRLLRWQPGSAMPTQIPVAVNGTLADIAVADDDSIYVLESTAESGREPLVRSFGPDGRARGASRIAERMASQLRMGPTGPIALEQPSGQWMPVIDSGTAVSSGAQREHGRPGRPLPDGDEVVILRIGDEIRAAIVGPGGVRRSWRISSTTPIGEVQLAQPAGNRLVLVFRVYTADQAEFVGLVVGPRGVERQIALQDADWAETAPLSRFRLVGSSLYRLGSTPSGLFVDRFDLEVK